MIKQERAEVHNVCAHAKKIITPADLIADLTGICESRFKAISMYPYAKQANEKFQVIHQIRYELQVARSSSNWKDKIKTCLRLEARFLFLAPTSTYKIYENYVSKISAYMNSCRESLAWRAQS